MGDDCQFSISITERKALTKLKDDPTLGGLTGLISKRAADDCRERIEKLLLHGIFRPTGKNI